jgi:NADPH-dependent 2,4-dienoyl-CoA reductase/sulfur reductase-like enzyme
MEDIIATGKADVVHIARGLIADPDIPRKIRTGREGEINYCLRCLSCFSGLLSNGRFYCAINPETNREAETTFALPPSEKKKVLIAGVTCAERGHEVLLCEKSERLGGVLRCEENVPFKQKVAQYLDRQADNVKKAGVEVRLSTEVTLEYAASEKADVLIAALGARAKPPPIPGIDSGRGALSAEEAYVSPEKTGSTVAILGAGLVGVELAIYLASLGRSVTVVEMLDEINHGGNNLHVRALNVEIAKYGINMSFNTAATEVTQDGVKCIGHGVEKLIRADTVVYATGQKPLWEDAERLSLTTPDFYIIGDCVTPKSITDATSMAYAVARNV